MASFLAGILVSFSPCIYPLIPITLGIVGAKSVSTRSQGFFLSLVFVLGIACTYTVLGIIAALMGVLLAHFFMNPLVYLGLGLMLLVLGLSLFDVIKLKILSLPCDYKHKGGIFSVFILGMFSALALVPCTFPVLGTIVSLIALKHSIIYGGSALFLFALGYGIILLVLGTFTSLLTRLPKAGDWLIIVKRVLGGVLILTAVYFLMKFVAMIRLGKTI
jgi:thiol:disulfide interchange protein DsbD